MANTCPNMYFFTVVYDNIVEISFPLQIYCCKCVGFKIYLWNTVLNGTENGIFNDGILFVDSPT